MNETETDKRRETGCPSAAPDEAQMVDEVYRRSEAGLHRMMDCYGALLQSLSMSILHDAGEAEECVNDTWLKVWELIPPYRPAHLRSFLCKLTRQISVDRYRAAHREKRGGADADLWVELNERMMAPERSPEDAETAAAVREAIEGFLLGQDVESRVLFTRRYFFCESLQSLAERYGTDPKLLAVKMARMRGKLKKYLEKEDIYL